MTETKKKKKVVKKTTTKKTSKKQTKQLQSEDIEINNNQVLNDSIQQTDIPTLPIEEETEIQQETLSKIVEEVNDFVKDFNGNFEDVSKPENMEEALNNGLEKITSIQERLEEKIKETEKNLTQKQKEILQNPVNISRFWNGMSYT